MENDNDINKINFKEANCASILIFSSIFIIIYLIYLIPTLLYIFNNIRNNKICVYWIDYTLLIISGIVFIMLYIFNITLNGGTKINSLKDLSSNEMTLSLFVFLILMCITLVNDLFFDSIIAGRLSYIMNKIKKVEETDFFLLADKLKEIKVVNILKFKVTFPYFLFIFIVDIIYIVFIILLYKDLKRENFGNFNLHKFVDYAVRWYHCSILVLLLLSILIMNITKKSLLKKHYYSSNRVAQRLYNVYFNQIIYFTDVISFKLVSDLIMNIPALFFLSQLKFTTISLIISELAIFSYIFLGGSEYLIIDKNSKAGEMSKFIKTIFCLKKIDYHLGEKDQSYTVDQFKFNYTLDEKKIFKSANTTFVHNIEINTSDLDENDDINFIGEKLELDETGENNYVDKSKKIEFKTVTEFYLIQKLMMLYYEKNKKVYEINIDNNEFNNLSLSLSYSYKNKKKINKIVNEQDKNNYILNIEELNRKSILNSKKINSFFKFSNNTIFYSITEKELYEEFKSNSNLKNEKFDFKIENLFASDLFELFPFYQMNINSIINSLEPSRNLRVFNKFANRNKRKRVKVKKERFSVRSNYGNNYEEKDEEEDDDIYENNLYYTTDLYLMYEIYDEDEFNFEKLKNIIIEYDKYLLSVVKNMKFSFLPLILGIFNIEIFNCKKFIILYRNPLYFTNFNVYNRWMNLFLTEETEQIKASTLFNDIVEINEEDIKNNLQFGEVDFDEIKEIFESDLFFIMKLNNVFPIIHLFIGEESNDKDNNNKIERNRNQIIENSLMYESASSKNIFDDLDKDTSISYVDNNNINENSLFEKEYCYLNANNIKTIKFYFTNLFRDNSRYNKIKAIKYNEFMLNKIFKYLSKNTLFNEESKTEE